MRPTSTNFFLQDAKKCGNLKGKDLGCTKDVEVFPSQLSEVYPSPDWQYGGGRYHAKGRLRPMAFQGVLTLWSVATPSAISNAGRTHFTLRLPPEQLRKNSVDLRVFTMPDSYLIDGNIDT